MKRSIIQRTLKAGLLAVPAAAMMLGTSHADQLGINFWGSGYQAATTNVTATAFGIGTNDWFTTSPVDDKEGTNVIALSGGGSVTLAWSAANTWNAQTTAPTPGNEEVTFGILDDGGSMWSVTLSGLRNFASDCTVQLIAATANSQTSFPDATLTAMAPASQSLSYTNGVYTLPDFGTASTSTVSTAYSMLSGNNTISMTAGPRDTRRSSLGGLILTYTPGNNAPLVESDPQAPVGLLFPGDPFSLSASASGSPTLAYQWRKDSVDLPGETNATYNVASAVVSDSGSYDLVVTNAYGADTSAAVDVTIQNVVSPVITQGPVSQDLFAGYPATFTVEATGGLLSYQWKSNTVAIADATNTSYTIASITTNDAGTYTIDVSNPVGPTASDSATLTVKIPTGEYEAAVVATQPDLWFRYSEPGPNLGDPASNSGGSLGATGDGQYVGNTTHPVAGALVGSSDEAASFAGGRVSVPYSASLNPATFTIEAWLKPEVVGGSLTSPLASMQVANPREGWNFYQSASGWNFRTYNQNGTTAAVNITGGPAPVAGEWYHVVGTWDGSVGRVYVNGVLSVTSGVTNLIVNPSAAFTVGARSDGAFAWFGEADEVAYYAAALSDAQILAHYQNGTNAAPATPYDTLVLSDNPIEYLRLNEPAIVPPVANSGTLGMAFDGSYNSDIAPGAVGPRPATFPGFESDNDSVAMTNGYTSAPSLGWTLNSVTMTCWIKREQPATTDDLSWLAWLGSSESGGFHLNDSSSPQPGELRYHWDGSQWGWGSGLFVPADVWTFCAMVLTPDDVTMYMSDGDTLLQSTVNAAHTAHTLDQVPGFGGGQAARASRNYIGQIDETTVHNRALSQSEITTLFLVASGAPFQVGIVPGGIIEDTSPSGSSHPGNNLGTTWLASSTDDLAATRNGVEVFNATNGTQIATPGSPDFNSTVGTFTFWMRTTDPFAPTPGPGSEAAMFMDRRTTAGAVITMGIGGEVFVQCAAGANTLSDFSYLPDGYWHLVAVTYDQSLPGGIEIFVDGFSTISQTNSAAWSWPAAQEIELGRSHDSYWLRYDGEMDDFRFYDRILTPTEIAAIHSSDALVDAGALKLRYNFDTPGIGYTVTWPFGTLESTPTLSPANWMPVPGATPPNYPTPAIAPEESFPRDSLRGHVEARV